MGAPAGAPRVGAAGRPTTGDSGGDAVCRLTGFGGGGSGGCDCGSGLRTVALGTAKEHQACLLRSRG